MGNAKFILSRKKLLEQVDILNNQNFKISYSYKTNNIVGNLLQNISDVDFSLHSKKEIKNIKDKSRIWFFIQAESQLELEEIFNEKVRKFVIDNEDDLGNLLKFISFKKIKINLLLRMKFQENRINSGRYFVYGMSSKKINELISELKDNPFIEKLGVHIHRKSQNINEWEIKKELKDSLEEETLRKIDILNLGGGLPVRYRSYISRDFLYILNKIKEAKEFLDSYGIEVFIEPGRFFSAPCIKLETEIIQIQDNNIIINTSIYNCALDTILTGTKMIVESERDDFEDGEFYLIKGNSPTRDDIFRYKVKLKNPKVGDKIIFLNAGAYNYTTDFFGYEKIPTLIE
jgi:ornithine decarboxylase